jgi:hypothetical protein
MITNEEKLVNLLQDMDVPEGRKRDWHWLNRNLFVRNHLHPDFEEAMVLLSLILGEQFKKYI